jgi:probable rRNA maturation factor
MLNIEFHNEDVDYELEHPDRVRFWIVETVRAEDGILGDLNFIFCSDEYLYQMNVDYLGHDTYTDVITFPYSEEHVEGDIFISVDRIRENAQTFGVTERQEMLRVIIHGVLHLLGYGDLTDEEEKTMREKEDFYLSMLGTAG